MEQQTKQQSRQSNNKQLMIVIITILCIAIIVGVIAYSWQKSANNKIVNDLEQRIASLEQQIAINQNTSNERQQIPSPEEQNLPETITSDVEGLAPELQGQNMAIPEANQENGAITPIKSNKPATQLPADQTTYWKTYRNDKYGFMFSYPAYFQIITDKVEAKFKEYDWYRLELTDSSVPEKPFMRFEVDPDGYGPFFPDKIYKISENSMGKIVINSISEEYTNDGIIQIIPTILKASNGHSYQWQFFFNEGGQDYEPIFKEILSSFQFSK